jgi:hypothetical protein
MTKYDWWCSDCSAVRELNKHGYCAVCGSDALDIAVRPSMIDQVPTVKELEKLYAKD